MLYCNTCIRQIQNGIEYVAGTSIGSENDGDVMWGWHVYVTEFHVSNV
jgi:hypothetical protein